MGLQLHKNDVRSAYSEAVHVGRLTTLNNVNSIKCEVTVKVARTTEYLYPGIVQSLIESFSRRDLLTLLTLDQTSPTTKV